MVVLMTMKQQMFNDGVLKIYKDNNIADPGDRPKEELELKYTNSIPYEERTIGINRFYSGKQNQTIIEQLLRIPRVNGINRNDIVIPNDGQQYRIEQIQSINDLSPKSLDLSLEKVGVDYNIKGY